MEEEIKKWVTIALAGIGAEDVTFAVEWPADIAYGDFAVNAALAASKQLGKSPLEIATLIAPLMQQSLIEIAASVSVAGPGFINIKLRSEIISDLLRASASIATWGMNDAAKGTRISIEYSCPNPFKEMHIGHLMSTVIGESLARLMEYTGAEVVRDTYGGDVGPHVAKTLWGLRDNGTGEPANAGEIGRAYEHGSTAYDTNETSKGEIDLLNTNLYLALAKETKDLSSDERALLEQWRIGREISVEAYREIWSRLGTHFDYVLFESETAPIGMRIVRDAFEKGIFTQSDGAIIYPGEEKGLHTLVFITSRNTPTYETKDVGLAFLKEEQLPSDQYFIVTAAEQVGHFTVFLAALTEIVPVLAEKITHIPHGFLRLTTGKMSSRKGTIITAEGLLRDVTVAASEKNDDPLIAEQVALAAIKYMILRQAPGGDIIFDPIKSLALDGDSGPYLQYSLVRAKSILTKAQESMLGGEVSEGPTKPFELSRLIIRFPQVIAKAQALQAPHVVAQYLTQLASSFNSFYAQEKIIGGEFEEHKLEIVRAFAMTMENGLWLLGIPVPEKM
jgi:arginyl-tRNA synthetase